MSQKKTAQEKYSNSRMFTFEGYNEEKVILESDKLPYDCEFLKYKLKCKKCDKIIEVDNSEKGVEIRCCKKKKEKKSIPDDEKIFNSIFNALTIGLDKEDKQSLKDIDNIKEKITHIREGFIRENR